MNEHGPAPDVVHVIWDDDDGDWCEHPTAAVISEVNGEHFCSVCNAEWWEDPL